MQAVGRLGSYISRGVYTVSGPFHPFGGAVDIVLVEQEDGSFKSSPWYVRFGKFQGVLKAKEKVVSISVNGVEANFHMYLDHKGEAFFLREVEAVEGESMIYPSFSGDETDSPTQDNKLLLNSKSCNYGSHKSNSVAKIDINNGNIVAGTNSNRSQMIGLAFGRRSIGGNNNFQGEFDNVGIKRVGSLECAEIAADLMEAKWSTNLAGDKPSRKASEKNKKSSSQRDNMENALNQLTLYEEACSHNEQEGICSKSDLEIPGGLSEEECENSSCLSTPDEVSKIFMVGESFSKEKAKVIGVSTSIDIAEDTEHDRKVKEVISDSTRCDLRAACLELEAHIEKKLSGEDVSSVSVKPGYGISEEEISADGIQSLVNGVTSESSMGGMDCSSERTHEVPYPAIGRCGEVHVHAEVLQATNFLLPEVTKIVEVGKNANLGMPKMKVSQQTDCSLPRVSKFNVVDVEDPPTLPKPRRVNLDLGFCSAEKVESNCVVTTSSYGSQGNQTLEEKNLKDEVVSSTLTSLESVSDCVLRRATSRLPSASSEDEHFFFSDFDESRFSDQCDCSISPEYVDEEDQVSYLDGIEKVNQLIDRNYSLHLSPENCATGNQLTDLENLRVTSSPTVIPKNEDPGKEVGPQTKSLPGMYSYSNALGQHDLCYPLSHSLDSKTQFLEKPLLGKDDLKCLKSAEGKENQLLPEKPGAKDCHGSGDSSALSPSPGRNWRLWPFSFRRSTSREAMVPASYAKNTNASESTIETDANKNELKPNPLKKNARANTPTSEQLASLNLKEGRNTVTFTFSTGMLGKQQVDAQIYLWKWNTRIVISDVDGTITKSDVLGQFMPLVGVDWSQTGVAHLFSAIKENGYQLLFLSARAISQAYHTRQFLINLKQDGKVLPDGPVVISPDGLFPSLFREVIRRTPHEFKIACLEDIRALFPSDCNPFYAGFGNRDTDEISYLKVGIPKGKIFIINPKGEVAVNRRHDTKSYTSLHALVNGMFPPMNSSEQEDFNSWNYWKLPPPVIDN